jgi:TonB family protein
VTLWLPPKGVWQRFALPAHLKKMIRLYGILLLSIITVLSGPRLVAQSYLIIENKGKAAIVRKVHDGDTYVMENGKLVGKNTSKSGLVPAPEFLPVFISVLGLDAHSFTSNVSLGLQSMSHSRLNLAAGFQSRCALSNVFIVLDLDTGEKIGSIFYTEIGELKPNKPKWIKLAAPLSGPLEAKYTVHLFCDGMEVFNSMQSLEYREAALDKMVNKRVAGLQDLMPAVLFGPAPEYPAAFAERQTPGKVVLNVLVTQRGTVLNPTVESATDPAFAEKALEAVRSWRFLPRIKDGHPIEAQVSLPFAFEPPESAEKR